MKKYNNLRRWGDFLFGLGILTCIWFIYWAVNVYRNIPDPLGSRLAVSNFAMGLAALLGTLFIAAILSWMADLGENVSRLASPPRVARKEDIEVS